MLKRKIGWLTSEKQPRITKMEAGSITIQWVSERSSWEVINHRTRERYFTDYDTALSKLRSGQSLVA